MKKIIITILIIAAGAYFAYTQFIFNNINTKIFSLDGAVSKIQKEIDSPYVLYNGKKIILGNNLGASITAAFPADLNNFAEDDTIEEEDLNAIEQTIGKTNSATSTTHDYLIRHGANTFDMAFNQVSLDFGLSAATGTFTGVLTADGGFAGKSSTTAAFATNPSNCSAGQYPLGIDTDGNVESCTADVAGTSNWQFIGPNAVRPTTTVGIIVNASSTISQVLNLDNYLSFTATSTPTTPTANHISVYAETTQGHTKLVFLDDDGLMFTMNRDNVFTAKNTSGSTINKGQAVYITGSTGNVPNVSPAQANSTSTLPAVGLATANISNNAFGEIMILGIISSIDTSAFATGDRVFVSPTTAGNLTNIRPNYSNFAQRMGSVMVSGVGNGSIYVTTAPFLGGEENWTASSAGFTAKSLTISANGSATTTIASGISTFAGGLISQASSTFNGSITALGGFNGNASTADALFVNGSNCTTGNYPLGIDASGNVESCTAIPSADGSSNWQYIGQNALRPTSTIGIIVNASSTFSNLTVTTTFAGGLSVGNNAALVVNQAASANSLYIATNGYVGIGTAGPGARFDIKSSATGETGAIRLIASDDTSEVLSISEKSGTTGTGYIRMTKNNVASNAIVFDAGGDSWFNTGGKVGIATTSPRYTLDVYGDFAVGTTTGSITPHYPLLFVDSGTGGTANGVGIGTTTVSGAMLTVGTTTPAFVVSQNGNVGIGTTGPENLLQVATGNSKFLALTTTDYSAANNVGSGFHMRLGANTGNTYSEMRALTGGDNAWGNLVLQSGGGNVGIGTTSPSKTLDVNGQITINSTAPELDLRNVNGGVDEKIWRIVAGEAAENLLEYKLVNDAQSASTNYLVIERSGTTVTDVSFPNGNVGIGTTTPSALLTVGATGAGFLVNSSGNATTTHLGISSITGSTQCLQIDSTGNISGTGSACGSSSADGSSNWQFTVGQSALTPTSTVGIIVSASSTFSNNVDIGKATSSEFTVTNGTNGVRITISGSTTTFTGF